jgi:hypothetical protein
MIVLISGARASAKGEIVDGFAMMKQLKQSRWSVAAVAMDKLSEISNAVRQGERTVGNTIVHYFYVSSWIMLCCVGSLFLVRGSGFVWLEIAWTFDEITRGPRTEATSKNNKIGRGSKSCVVFELWDLCIVCIQHIYDTKLKSHVKFESKNSKQLCPTFYGYGTIERGYALERCRTATVRGCFPTKKLCA